MLASKVNRRPPLFLLVPADGGKDLKRPGLRLLAGKNIRRLALILHAPAKLASTRENLQRPGLRLLAGKDIW